MSEYVVIYEQAEDGAWAAFIPDLPGVVALGTTRSPCGTRGWPSVATTFVPCESLIPALGDDWFAAQADDPQGDALPSAPGSL